MRNYNKLRYWKHNLVYLILAILCLGCKRLVEVDSPITSTNSDIVYANDATATAVLTNVYTSLSMDTYLSIYPALSADELSLQQFVTDQSLLGYYNNSLNLSNTSFRNYWSAAYKNIYIANVAIEGLEKNMKLTPSVKQQLLGESRFIRAFFYFYLINLYGDVPLHISTENKLNAVRPRTETAKVYQQIIADLTIAKSLLGTDYLDASSKVIDDRTRPNQYSATALLARVYLYTKNYAKAEEESSSLIENTTVFDTVPLANVFLKESKETIWSLQSVSTYVTNTQDAFTLKLPLEGPDAYNYVYILNSALKDSFEPTDNRKDLWLDHVVADHVEYYFPNKYKQNQPFTPVTEQRIIFRIAEQYLIRAEARAAQNKLTIGTEDLNVIRNRAGLASLFPTTTDDLITAILHERQVELFTEWGHRWFDLKRSNTINPVLSLVKGAKWQPTDQLYPIPLDEINNNPAIRGHQNAGY